MHGRNKTRGRFTSTSGKTDRFDIHVCHHNIFENQIVPVELHKLSKSFKPNLATMRILSVGTKLIRLEILKISEKSYTIRYISKKHP